MSDSASSSHQSLMAFGHAIAGAVGGVYSMTLTYPLFMIATRMQSKAQGKGGMELITKIIREEGVLALFSGVQSAWIGVFVSQGVFYYGYEFFKSMWSEKFQRKNLTTGEHLFLAAVAGWITAIASNPIWVVNTQMANDKNPDKTMVKAAKNVVKDHGWAGFFNGIGPALFMVINPTIQHAVYERLKAIFLLQKTTKAATGPRGPELSSAEIFWLGALAKAVATVMAYPGHTVKIRLFASKKSDDTNKDEKKKKQENPTVPGAIRQIYKESGWVGFYAGMKTKLLQSVLTAALLFVAKERLTLFSIKLAFFIAGVKKPRN